MPEPLLHTAEIAHAVLRVPYFLDAARHEQCLSDPEMLEHPDNSQRKKIAVATLRLIEKERKNELIRTHNGASRSSQLVREWNQSWEPTPERITHTIRRNPLSVLKLARGLMRIHNSERIPENEDWDAYIALNALAAQCDCEPIATRSHLRRAGYTNNLYLYPPDAADYLAIYPPTSKLQTGEKSTTMLESELDVSNMIKRIVDDLGLYPEVRIFDGQGGREIEIWTRQDIISIQEEVTKIPRRSNDETFLSKLKKKYGSYALITKAINLAGITSFWRRHEKGVPGRGLCIKNVDLLVLHEKIIYLTQRQPGERSAQDMARELKVSLPALRNNIPQEDLELAREIFQASTGKGKGRYAHELLYPEEVFLRVKERLEILRALGIQTNPAYGRGKGSLAMELAIVAEAAIAAARQQKSQTETN